MAFKKFPQKRKSFLDRLIGVQSPSEQKPLKKIHLRASEEKIAPLGSGFFLHNGKEVRTMQELVLELSKMSDEEWSQYAHFGNNHFANWIEGVFAEHDLAVRIRQAHDRETMRGVISVFLL